MKKIITLLTGMMLAVSLVLTGTGSKAGAAAEAKEKVLVVGRMADSVILDPINASDNESWRATEQIYDNLVVLNPKNFDIIPSLATSWKISPDGKVYTFTLRDGVKFHDGTDFNAAAVVFNIVRWWDKSNPYHTGGTFPYFTLGFGGFKGDPKSIIQDVKAVDKNHVQITLNSPFAPFLYYMAMCYTPIASPDAIKKYGDQFGRHPVGTGPFIFQEWKTNDTLSLVKNPIYWQKGLPKLDKLIFRTIPDATARLTALQNGELDLMDGLNPSDVASVTGDRKLQLIKRPAVNVGEVNFNVTKPPFDNVKVRQALSMAVNKQGLIDAFYYGLAIPAKSVLSASSWAYNQNLKDYQYDPDAAKKLLAEAGYPNGFTTDFWVMPVSRPYMPQPQTIAESLQADFAKIGVKTNIISLDWATYLKKAYNGEIPMAMWGLTITIEPDYAMTFTYDKNRATPPNATNIALYKSDKVTDLIGQARKNVNQNERAKLYAEAQQIAHDDAPILFLVHSIPVLAAADYVKNFIPLLEALEKYENVDIQK
ncbi:ABC transporter substrate-binding protein [uncultured Desulfosarcina sp.]|uniref:ABC transporter substrate-binding protein n=1 Tax=uncultured Desulfosarcina sp. TaxID=218289 RepID=UPI0029C8E902|nr:ABC transporter substrate-binding protein [uncultured Desulfosarcina sp.]